MTASGCGRSLWIVTGCRSRRSGRDADVAINGINLADGGTDEGAVIPKGKLDSCGTDCDATSAARIPGKMGCRGSGKGGGLGWYSGLGGMLPAVGPIGGANVSLCIGGACTVGVCVRGVCATAVCVGGVCAGGGCAGGVCLSSERGWRMRRRCQKAMGLSRSAGSRDRSRSASQSSRERPDSGHEVPKSWMFVTRVWTASPYWGSNSGERSAVSAACCRLVASGSSMAIALLKNMWECQGCAPWM